MESRHITTDAGDLELTSATDDELRPIERLWPMGLLPSNETPPRYGLVFQRGEQEMYGIKFQPVDLAHKDAVMLHFMSRALVAAALPFYLEKHHSGLMVPSTYVKEKGEGKVEAGVAVFVGPDASSSTSAESERDLPDYAGWDDELGTGATQMILDMLGALRSASDEADLPMIPLIGMDLRPRLALGGIVMHFAVVGAQVLVIKDQIDDDEPVWRYLVRAGFSRLPAAPMLPIRSDDE
jgi:hypothetical protein